MYDFIGDIHGHADELEQLLVKMGYHKNNGVYAHAERKAFFLGDFIDRGPKIRETLQIVKSMTDAGFADAIMGNHEYNAICFHLQETAGGHLRPHSIKNILQHFETLKQFQNRQEEYDFYIEWFMTLPVFWEEESFRAAHACWDENHIALLNKLMPDGKFTEQALPESLKDESPLHTAVDETLKGKEIPLPAPLTFTDKDGTVRKEIRIKWWMNPAEATYHSYSVHPEPGLPHAPVSGKGAHYPETGKPVFFGHYWLQGIPQLLSGNICCLDFSVAKGGSLAAYRFDGEAVLDPAKLVFV